MQREPGGRRAVRARARLGLLCGAPGEARRVQPRAAAQPAARERAARGCSDPRATAGRRRREVASRRALGTVRNGRSRRNPASSRTAAMPARPSAPLCARLAQRDGFRLIVQMMAEQQVQDPGGAAPVAEQAIARFPGGRLDAGRGLGAGPAQDVMVDPARAQPRGDLPGFRRRLRAQAMVDDQRADRAAPRCRPAGRRAGTGTGCPGRPTPRPPGAAARSNGPSASISPRTRRRSSGRAEAASGARGVRPAPGPAPAGCGRARSETPRRARRRCGRPCRSPAAPAATCRA